MQNRIDEMVVRFAEQVLRFRWLVMALAVILAVAAASGGRFLAFDTNYRVFFGKDNPQLLAFDAVETIYSKNDNVMFVLKPKSGDAFSPAMLQAMAKLTEGGWQLPFSTRVDSIPNFQHSYAVGDDLTVEDLVRDTASLDQAGRDRVASIAMDDPLLFNRLVAADRGAAAVNVTITLPRKEMGEVPSVMASARTLAEEVRGEFPDIELVLTGMVPMNAAFEEASINDISFLIPIMYGVLILAMIGFLRSFSGTLGTVFVIGLSAATAMGLAGWLGIRLTPPSATAPTIILSLAIADSVHILVVMFAAMRRGMDKRAAIVESLRVNFGPVFLTSLTTAIGFLTLNSSDAPPFHDLGNITAMGVMAAWVYSIFFLPAFMSVMPVRVKVRETAAGEVHRPVMERWADFVIEKRNVLLVGTAGAVILLGAMIPRIVLDDRFVEYFTPNVDFRSHTDYAQEHLTGIYQVEFSVEAGESGGVSNPEYLAKLSGFTDWLRAQPETDHVNSITDIFKRLNKNMHGDDAAAYTLPTDRELAAQYLLLYEMSLPFGLDLNNQINVDKSATRVTVTFKNSSTKEVREFTARAESWLKDNTPAAMHAIGTSPTVMFAYISERNIRSMLLGTTTALILISLCLVLALRSIKLGLLSMVPNLAPAVVTFGAWSLFVGEVGLASSVITATSLGLIVDATVHFLSKYMRARRSRGETPEDAIRYALNTVGTALWTTTAIVVAGFGDHTSVLSMVLKNKSGQTSTRKLDMATLEIPDRGRGDKTMIVFNHPRDVKGTAMLTHTKILDTDDQWLFLPALKRVKRISSANKSGPFVGSEFAFEDLASQEVDKYAYKHLRDEACGDLQCFVVERKPLYEYSGYTRQVVWIDKQEYRQITVEFYDRKNELLKTLNFNKYQQYLDQYWRSHELVMVNHQTGKSTVLAFDDYRFKTGLKDRDFSKTVLRRQR